MPLMPLLIAVMILVAALMAQSSQDAQRAADRNEAAVIDGNLRIYRNAVVDYAALNPTASGSIGDAALGLPTWFNHIPEVSNVVTGGKAYVYYASPPPGLAYRILKSTDNSTLVGINRGGILHNPLSGNTGITLPASIPEGSVVYAAG